MSHSPYDHPTPKPRPPAVERWCLALEWVGVVSALLGALVALLSDSAPSSRATNRAFVVSGWMFYGGASLALATTLFSALHRQRVRKVNATQRGFEILPKRADR
ncbi:MAG TPA: hypothetical protein VEA69_07005 [Tepidisphaeraceae bacterium]|nr:hypothetical protein [Tepidisphaeraceae bacterium]